MVFLIYFHFYISCAARAASGRARSARGLRPRVQRSRCARAVLAQCSPLALRARAAPRKPSRFLTPKNLDFWFTFFLQVLSLLISVSGKCFWFYFIGVITLRLV
jgi:hypothetical protein